MTLASACSYSGATAINNGTLLIGLSLPVVSSGTLQRWFDATDLNANGSPVANGAVVATWSDKSGQQQNAISAGGVSPIYVANAINGKPAVQLGPNSYLSFSNNGLSVNADASTMFAVGEFTSAPTTWNWMVSYGNFGYEQGRGISASAGAPYNLDYTTVFQDTFGAGVPLTTPPTPVVADVIYGGATNSVAGYWNISGQTGAASSNPALGTGYFGSGFIGKGPQYDAEWWAGNIGEVLIYNGALSDADRAAVESYLDSKWLGIGNGGGQVLPANTPVSIGSSGILDLGGNSQQVGALTGSGMATNSGVIDATLTVAGTSEFDGVLSNGATNKLGLTVSGSLTLAGSNTFTGPTTVNAGALQIGNGGERRVPGQPGRLPLQRRDAGVQSLRRADLQRLDQRQRRLDRAGEQRPACSYRQQHLHRRRRPSTPARSRSATADSGEGLTSSITMSNNATVAFNHADPLSYGGAISGSGQLIKLGTGVARPERHEHVQRPDDDLRGNGGTRRQRRKSADGDGPDHRLQRRVGPGRGPADGGQPERLGRGDHHEPLLPRVLLDVDRGPVLRLDDDFAGNIIGNNVALALSGSGELTLSGTNSYTGGTTVSGGTLDIAAPERIVRQRVGDDRRRRAAGFGERRGHRRIACGLVAGRFGRGCPQRGGVGPGDDRRR